MSETWAAIKFLHISQTQREGIGLGQSIFHNSASMKDKVLGFLETNFFLYC